MTIRIPKWVLVALGGLLVAGCGEGAQTPPPPGGLGPTVRTHCDRFVAPHGSDSAPGTRSRPLASATSLVGALRRGQTGCFRAGSYNFSVLELTTPRVTLAPFRGEGVTLNGDIKVLPQARGSVITGMKLDGAAGVQQIGPKIYADGVVLRDNEITNQHTAICVLITGYYSGPPPRGVVVEDNRIHDCGALPPTNHQHGIYVANAVDTMIRDNWIYDNADRGIQLYPNAQRTTIVGNVIDGNGEGIVFSGQGREVSNHNVVERNVISNSRVRWNVYSGAPGVTARGNVLRDNCVWAEHSPPAYQPRGGVETPSRNFSARNNVVADPRFADPVAGDYTLSADSRCPLARHLPGPWTGDAAGFQAA